MTADFAEDLDSALARLRTGESITAILADYPTYGQTLDPYLRAATALETVRPVELPASESLREPRACSNVG